VVLKGEGEGARHETPGRAGFHVGGWWVEPKAGQLVKGRQVVRLEPKAMEVLNYLVARAGEVVSREELERDVWRGALVGYDAVTKTVIKLRKALGDSAHEPAFIQTVPKRGYRLVAPVDTTAPAECGPAVVPGRPERPDPIRQRILVASGLVLIVAAAALALLYRAGSLPGAAPSGSADRVLGVEAPGRGSPTVAVLPFEVLGADQDQLYLARGLTADLISDLSSLSGLAVVGAPTGSESSRGSGVGAPNARPD
jgi:DNA-binding winged helix-turn-helix (wHTH) protein